MTATPASLDIAASRTGNRVFLHVANLEYRRSVEASFVIALDDLRQYVGLNQPDMFKPRETALVAEPAPKCSFPAGSISVVELDVRAA